jgi:ribonuclease HI
MPSGRSATCEDSHGRHHKVALDSSCKPPSDSTLNKLFDQLLWEKPLTEGNRPQRYGLTSYGVLDLRMRGVALAASKLHPQRSFGEEEQGNREGSGSLERVGRLVCHFDGSCQPKNPGGTARYGWVIRKNGTLIERDSKIVGTGDGMTCNVAEAAGALYLIRYILDRCPDAAEVWIYGDSTSVINRLKQRNKAPKGVYAPIMIEAQQAAEQLLARCPTYFHWVPREQNTEADELSNGFYRERARWL